MSRGISALCFGWIVACLGLSSCTNIADQHAMAARIDAADHEECLRLGFVVPSSEYGDCRLRLREMRLQERLVNRPIYVDPYFGPRWGIIHR
jgi:hypothetical protein